MHRHFVVALPCLHTLFLLLSPRGLHREMAREFEVEIDSTTAWIKDSFECGTNPVWNPRPSDFCYFCNCSAQGNYVSLLCLSTPCRRPPGEGSGFF